jgi:hypothetical protein
MTEPPQSKQKLRIPLSFWLKTAFVICVLAAFGVYLQQNYFSNESAPAQTYVSHAAATPAITVAGQHIIAAAQGQMLDVQGAHFNVGAAMIFMLDGKVPINGTDGRQMALEASIQGAFEAAIPVTAGWSIGRHFIVARDNNSGQDAYLIVHVIAVNSRSSGSIPIKLSTPQLTFQATLGQGNPQEQFVTLTNSSTAPLHWTAKAVTDDQATWLTVSAATTSSKISAGANSTLGIDVLLTNLKSEDMLHTGSIVLTINGTEHLTLPVELYLSNSAAEVALSPDPVIGLFSPVGNTCQPNTELLLMNLGKTAVKWTLTLDANAKQHIAFNYQGKPLSHGLLALSGQAGDTQVLTLSCTHAQLGASYSFTITAQTVSWSGAVDIQGGL